MISRSDMPMASPRDRAALPVPFDTFHLNDQPADVRAAGGGAAPIVIAETDRDIVVLLGDAELSGCAGSVPALSSAVEQAASRAGLRWP